MKKITGRLLSLLLAVVMLFGVLPTTVLAAEQTNREERTLELDVEQEFQLENSQHEVQFTYTAKEAGTYIFYFKDLSSNPISIWWDKTNIEYHYDPDVGHFEGRVLELNKDESFSVGFGVSEGYDTYGATVGVTTLPTEFTGFYTK